MDPGDRAYDPCDKCGCWTCRCPLPVISAPPAAAQGEEGDEAMVNALSDTASRYTGDIHTGTQADIEESFAVHDAARTALLARLSTLRAERDAYKRAKAENDDRFMRERDEARAERDAAIAKADVCGGEWCRQNREEGRGPCGACAWCCEQASESAADGWRTADRERDVAAAMTAERDAARAERDEAISARDAWAKQCNYASEDAANLRAALAAETSNANTYARQRDAAVREADRWRHGVPIEGDYVCPDSLALDAVRAAGARLAEAVRAMDIRAEETGYGFYHPENPHDFSPDEESCTPQEIANHKAACEAYDAGARAAPPDVHQHVVSDDGKTIASLLIAPCGIGSYTLRDEAASAVLDALAAWDAVAAGKGEGR